MTKIKLELSSVTVTVEDGLSKKDLFDAAFKELAKEISRLVENNDHSFVKSYVSVNNEALGASDISPGLIVELIGSGHVGIVTEPLKKNGRVSVAASNGGFFTAFPEGLKKSDKTFEELKELMDARDKRYESKSEGTMGYVNVTGKGLIPVVSAKHGKANTKFYVVDGKGHVTLKTDQIDRILKSTK